MDISKWIMYIDFLTESKVAGAAILRQFAGIKESRGKNPPVPAKLRQALKYLKNKILSYEVSYIMDSAPLSKQIKDNILKSMWMYAASEGFTIFNKNKNVTFLLASSYVKCAA